MQGPNISIHLLYLSNYRKKKKKLEWGGLREREGSRFKLIRGVLWEYPNIDICCTLAFSAFFFFFFSPFTG